jgi:hypothetical protein
VAKITHIKPEWFLKRKARPRQKPRPTPLITLLSVFRPTIVQLFAYSTFIFILLRILSWNHLVSYVLASLLALLLIHRSRWLWPLIKCVSDFIPFEGTQVQVFYDATLGGTWKPSVIVEDCERQLVELSSALGIRFRGKLLVFFFANSKEIGKIFGRYYGATALPRFNAIVIGNSDYVQETIRHELTHLLTAQWQNDAPPLLAEGIATWIAGSHFGQVIHATAQAILLNAPPKLELLLTRRFFFSDAHRRRCYILAGSFTGFLIRRYGWDKYRRLYRHSYDIGFRLSFKQLMGITFEAAENLWRDEIISGKWSKFRK